MDVSRWGRWVYRLFGGANVCFAVLGFCTIAFTVTRLTVPAEVRAVAPFTYQVMIIMTVINGLFLAALTVSGIWLLRLRPNAVRMCNVLFSAEILYFFGISFLAGNFLGLTEKVARSIGAATGVGNMAIGSHLVIGYPILALIVLNVVRHKLRRAGPVPGPLPEPN